MSRKSVSRSQEKRSVPKICTPQEGMQTKMTRSNCDVCFAGGVLNPQPLTSSILTPKGFVKFADLNVGDEICGLENAVQTVTHCDYEGEKNCIRLTLDDGSSAESALDHKWWIYKDGCEDSAISFELLESYQIAVEKGESYNIDAYRLENGVPVRHRIKNVEDIGMKEVVCVGVSNSDELYITDDYLITKNCGKAQPYSSRVLTPGGFVTMGSLKEGTVLCRTDGGTQKVVAVYEKGERTVFRLEFEGGAVVEASADHLWSVIDDGGKHTRSTEEILAMTFSGTEFRVETVHPVTFHPMRNKCIPGGVGDMIMSDKTGKEAYNVGRAVAMYVESCPNSENSLDATLNSIGGIERGMAVFPRSLIVSSIRNRKHMIRGFLSLMRKEETADGGYRIRIPAYLDESLKALVESVGGYVETDDIEWKLYRDVVLKLPGFVMNESSKNETMCRKLVKIYKTDRKEHMRCIRVSAPNHLYITDGFIPTHNTFAAILTVAEPSLDPNFRAVFTRRNLANLKAGGGIVDDFSKAYGDYVSIKISDNPRITFPSGAFVDCIHIADEKSSSFLERIKGYQFDFAYMDELTSYEFSTFSILGTRVRGRAKFTGHIFGTTNPKRSHWTRKMLDWYIGSDGFINPERDGVVRYYYQTGKSVGDIVWGDSKEEVYEKCMADINRKLKKLGGNDWTYRNMIRSFVFYSGKMSENKASIGGNANYIGAVSAVGGTMAQQLIEGNFNVDEDYDDKLPISQSDAIFVFDNDECSNGDLWLTVDLADVGTDNLVALAWNGFHVFDIMIISQSTPRMNYEKIKMFATRYSIPDNRIIYDGTRATYMYDYMPDAIPFISASAPIGIYALMSDRLKDECYLRLAWMISNGKISIAENVGQHRYAHQKLDELHTVQMEFLEECTVVRFREKTNGRQKLLTKKEMNQMLGKERSMDVLDPMAMRMYPVLGYQYGDEISASEAFGTGLIRENADVSGNFNIYDESNWY